MNQVASQSTQVEATVVKNSTLTSKMPSNPGSQAGSGVTKPVSPEIINELSGTQITNVKAISAADANKSFIERGWNAPYDSSTQVRQFTTVKEVEFVRGHTESNVAGQFMVRADEIKGMTAQQILQHLALPSIPTHISDVKVPAGTKMQVGTVAPQPLFGAPNKGGTQYQLLQQIPLNNFYNTRPLK